MSRVIYTLVGFVLMPVCWAAGVTLYALLIDLYGNGSAGWSLGGWWFLGGFSLWTVLFYSLPKPVKTYVLAHELTHAFWGVIMGARVSNLRVHERGGSVQLSKTNFLITLAPYFFPFYAVLVLAAWLLVGIWYDMKPYEPFWLGAVGLTWAFHLTFTIDTLSHNQPDIQIHGRIFSYTLILTLNLIGISLWIVGIGKPTWAQFAGLLLPATREAYVWILDAFGRIWHWAASLQQPR